MTLQTNICHLATKLILKRGEVIHVGQMTRIGEGRSTETRVKVKERSTVDTQAKAAKIVSPRNLAASSFDHAEPIEIVSLFT